MKTCDEMLESVLSRAKVDIAKRKHRNKTILQLAATGLCLALILGLTLAPWSPEQPPLPTEGHIAAPPSTTTTTQVNQEEVIIPMGGVYFLGGKEDGAQLGLIQPDMTYTIDHVIRVFPLKALMWPALIEESKREAEEFYNDWLEKYHGVMGEESRTIYRSDEVIVYSLSAGFASVILPDYTQIVKVETESTGVLQCSDSYALFNVDYTIGKGDDAVTIPKGSYRVYLTSWLTGETIKFLEENPDTPLSTLCDTYTLTIHYKNGTKAIVILDVTLDDDGQVYITMRGNSDM